MENSKIEEKLVSIITPAFNCEKYIGYTIDSVLRQTYKNWEMIIVDDNSKDNTADVINGYLVNDNRIRYYKLDENSGAAVARNKAVEMASGEFLAFLDSDDIWYSNKLSQQIEFMVKNNYNFTFTSYDKIDESGELLNHTVQADVKKNYNDILKNNPGNSTVIYNSSELGKFKIPEIKKRNDYVMWLKIIKKAKYIYGINQPLGSHRLRPDSLSSKKINLVGYHWKVYRDIEKLSFIKSVYLLSYWVISSIFNRNLRH